MKLYKKLYKPQRIKQLSLAAAIIGACQASMAVADDMIPQEALPPTPAQQQPVADSPSTAVVVEVADAETSNTVADTKPDDKPTAASATTTAEHQPLPVSDKTRNEIRAMLADVVQQAKQVVVIEKQPLLKKNKQNAEANNANSEPPIGKFNLFAAIPSHLTHDNPPSVALQLQLSQAGKNKLEADRLIKEQVIKVNPQQVRKSETLISKFLSAALQFEQEGEENAQTNTAQTADTQDTAMRPAVDIWLEVKSPDGNRYLVDSADKKVQKGSTLVIYYKPKHTVYMNLYLKDGKGNLKRLAPGQQLKNNLSKAEQIYRFPPTGDGLPIDSIGENRIRAIYTLMPSGLNADMGLDNGLGFRARQEPIGIIPTQYPAVFTSNNLTYFFSLPKYNWNEKEISIDVK